VVGMLLYLASNSRPDIAFAVHQCARFSHCPCSTHEIAVKKICRYLLKGRFDQGIIFTPTPDAFDIECYCDSDFVGLFGSEDDSTDPVCCSSCSRTGYVILPLLDVPSSGCPNYKLTTTAR